MVTERSVARVLFSMRRLVRDPWFKDKTVGWGLTPARWQGWAVTAALPVALCTTLLAPLLLVRHRGIVAYEVYIAVAACEVLAFIAVAVLTSTWLKGSAGSGSGR